MYTSIAPFACKLNAMTSAATNRLQVLVLEDNRETRLLLRYLLTSNHDVTFTSTAAEAIAADERSTFDLYILDINLGGEETGVDVLQALRARHRGRRIQSIALTAYARPSDRRKFIKEGFDYFLAKPFTQEKLNSILQQIKTAA